MEDLLWFMEDLRRIYGRFMSQEDPESHQKSPETLQNHKIFQTSTRPPRIPPETPRIPPEMQETPQYPPEIHRNPPNHPEFHQKSTKYIEIPQNPLEIHRHPPRIPPEIPRTTPKPQNPPEIHQTKLNSTRHPTTRKSTRRPEIHRNPPDHPEFH